MNSYMRGEKPDVANPIVAWASQTGKGLLYFNKKGNTIRKSPESVLALYDATDLRKQPPHDIAFKLHGSEHVLKASSDNERDGWYMSIEKSMELGKATKDEMRESEGYKTEMEKLSRSYQPLIMTVTILIIFQTSPTSQLQLLSPLPSLRRAAPMVRRRKSRVRLRFLRQRPARRTRKADPLAVVLSTG